MLRFVLASILTVFLAWTPPAPADDPGDRLASAGGRAAVKRVLLLGQGPDNHPFGAHEYMAGMHVLARCLHPVEGLQTVIVKADEPWAEGPELLDGADGAVVFLSEGAKWLSQDRARLAAFQRLAERGGGLVVLHWGMGCRDAGPIDNFVRLFGACHGGPDRKFKVLTATLEPATDGHPLLAGIRPLRVHDEFYYRLKQVPSAEGGAGNPVTPLLRVTIDDEPQLVAWAWERPDGGRSAGFSGGHFHETWKHEAYRRFMAQAVLWTLELPVPDEGLAVELGERELKLEPRSETPEPAGQTPAAN
ncbi:MAG TPA: ThuA domain-containing protein [Planctomycetaceae bacterium]|nr:ThuA domain-containing protein [Planctomycetaceae bacterium]